MRCFIAVDIDKQIKSKIIKLQNELPVDGLKIVNPDNLHFTMKFIGECTDDDIRYIEDSLSKAILNHTQFSVDVHGIGAFPYTNYIKVIWISAPNLSKLMKSIRDALPKFKDDHEALPHLTIARVKSPESKEELQTFLKKHENDDFGSLNVQELKLKQSTLTPNGPIYEDLKVFNLSK